MQMQKLWLQFQGGLVIDIEYDEMWQRVYDTFEKFVENFKTGWDSVQQPAWSLDNVSWKS